ncbi:formylglycine-generating enzyme family protein [Pontibacter qinzhouensis]|nr:formylglycine-generating enzyme family protein [Pontibacter qinzhouensis]
MKSLSKKAIAVYSSMVVGIFAVSSLVAAPFFMSKANPDKALYPEMALIPGGMLETENSARERTKERIAPFYLDKNLVTVAEFDAFVKATGYTTEAEKFGNSGVFNFQKHGWDIEEGANYLYPFGKDKPAAQPDHPVTQVSWNDARAYAAWRGKRLPTQWEWEWAAMNGQQSEQVYTWGNQLMEGGKYKANTWQGAFPAYNTLQDGYEATSPVGAFGENKMGLTDMGGNVWQWCHDDVAPNQADASLDPGIRKVLRGGSFLCDPGVCHGYQIKGRASSTPESAMVHIGFRCAKDINQD